MITSSRTAARTDIRNALRLQDVLDVAASVGMEEALRRHGESLPAAERALLSGLSVAEVRELQNTVQLLGDPDCVAMDNNI
ncbi:hypothetical protein ACF1HU_36175 [Streptomyces olivaceus]|uniref:hypothetical protein n=1 Tax=Streptomyces TaxID=1883 RepID=UPI0004C83DB5|nr:hypothetical protein [Streptomyces olivaceus]MBZ6107984.1 hypothetical protein [Streptomyces olivaceus]